MKKFIVLFLNLSFLIMCISGCGTGTLPNEKTPVTLTMWHVYGSQTKSPLNDAIEKFNETVGKEQGIVVNVVSVTSSSAIDKALSASANQEPGAESLPDLFTAYPRVAQIVGKEHLLCWDEYFSEEELSFFKEEFLSEGYFDGRLLMLPVAKSSEAFYLNKTLFDKFSRETSVTLQDLSTFEGIFQTANLYYDWSEGQNFTQFNDYYHYALIGMKACDSELLKDGKLQLNDPAFEKIWTPLAKAAIYGGICLDDGYAAARWKTVEIISSIGSTADILYLPDMVIYPDNATETISALALPYPVFAGKEASVVHRGGGLFAVKNSDERKNSAAAVFAKWLTEDENNLAFVTEAGYLPVTDHAFEVLFDDVSMIQNENYRDLYKTVSTMMDDYKLYSLPLFDNASEIQHDFEQNVKSVLKSAHYQYVERTANGETPETVLEELTKASYEQLKSLSFH